MGRPVFSGDAGPAWQHAEELTALDTAPPEGMYWAQGQGFRELRPIEDLERSVDLSGYRPRAVSGRPARSTLEQQRASLSDPDSQWLSHVLSQSAGAACIAAALTEEASAPPEGEGSSRLARQLARRQGVVESHHQYAQSLVDPDEPMPLLDSMPLDPIEVEQPSMSITFGVNKSPFAGRAGKLLTSRNIRDRLSRELETNVALRVEDTEDGDTVLVSGRGLLHLTVLIETMRREGFEMYIGCPTVIEKTEGGERQEPFELVDIELPESYSGSAIDLLNQRKGSMLGMSSATKEGMVTIEYEVPSRGMNGVKSKLLSATRGLAVMSTTFAGYKTYAGSFGERDRGNLLSFETGTTSAFSLAKIQERGALFSGPGDEVYEDQIIGINAKSGDLKVNACKTKALTNMRSAGNDEKSNCIPPMQLTLEDAVEYIQAGEFVEVTPDAVRMGKKAKAAGARK